MRRLRFLLAGVSAAALLFPSYALSWIHGVRPCPYGQGLGDGCPAPGGGQQRFPNAMIDAKQSGQTWYNNHPQTWNLACIDFTCGNQTSKAALEAGGAGDPANLYAHACTGSGIMYCATGSPLGGGPYIRVNATSAPAVIAHVDFSGNDVTGFGHACTPILIAATSTYPVTITDWYFENSTECYPTLATYNSFIAPFIAGSAPLDVDVTISHFAIRGYGRSTDCCSITGQYAAGAPAVDILEHGGPFFISITSGKTASRTFTLDYGYSDAFPGHLYGLYGAAGYPANVVITHNYFTGFHTLAIQGHGEAGNLGTTASIVESYDTFQTNSYNCSCDTALNAINEGSTPDGKASGTLQVDHSLYLPNLTGGSHVGSDTISGVITAGDGSSTLAQFSVSSLSQANLYVGGGMTSFEANISQNVSGTGVGSVWNLDGSTNSPVIFPGQTTSIGVAKASAITGSPVTVTNATISYGTASYDFSLGHGNFSSVTLSDNYWGTTGLGVGPFAVGAGTCSVGATFLRNVNLETGATIPDWAGGAGASGCVKSYVLAAPGMGWTLYRNDFFTAADTAFWQPGLYNGSVTPASPGDPWQATGVTGAYTSGGSGGVQDTCYNPSQNGYGAGGLTLTASLSSACSAAGFTWLSGAMTSKYNFPATTACAGASCNTGGSFGAATEVFIQFSGQMPDLTQGGWSGYWLLGTPPPNGACGTLGELDINEGGFYNSALNHAAYNYTIHHDQFYCSGANELQDQDEIDAATSLTDWHVYGVDFKPGATMTLYLDGQIEFAFPAGEVPTWPLDIMIQMAMASSTACGFHSCTNGGTTGPYVMSTRQMRIDEK